jgi:cytochrome c oxidase subunit IV
MPPSEYEFMSEHLKERLEHGDLLDVGSHDEHGGVGKYIAVFFALCCLTTASFFTYSSYWPFSKEVAWAFMLAVSCTKAMLVIMFFMHLYWEANWKWVLTIPASFMSIFLMLMLIPDVGMRQNNGYERYSWERWVYAANPHKIMVSDQKALEAEEKAGPHSLSPGLPGPTQ